MNRYTSTSTYTSPLQSVALGKFLPIESADMYYHTYPSYRCWHGVPNIGKADLKDNQMPCWSLAALVAIIPNVDLTIWKDGTWVCSSWGKEFKANEKANNPIDACYKMIIGLKEEGLL